MEIETSNARKYATANPMVRGLLNRFLGSVTEEVRALEPRRVVDLGCGEGFVAERIAQLPGVEYRGFDINPEAVHAANQRVAGARCSQGDLLQLEPEPGWADVVLCLEVLEHLESPREALRRIRTWTRAHAVISVPWEPYFRLGNLARGKHIRTWGNTPEHVQQFHPHTLEALVRTEFAQARIRGCFPWLLAIASV